MNCYILTSLIASPNRTSSKSHNLMHLPESSSHSSLTISIPINCIKSCICKVLLSSLIMECSMRIYTRIAMQISQQSTTCVMHSLLHPLKKQEMFEKNLLCTVLQSMITYLQHIIVFLVRTFGKFLLGIFLFIFSSTIQ